MEGAESEEMNLQELTESEKTALTYLADLGLSWEQLQGKKILDLGAGAAGFASEAKKRGVEVISVDNILGGLGNDGKIPDVPYVVADITRLPLEDNSFDLVLSRAVIHGLKSKEDIRKAIEETKRVLKSGGEFRFGPGPHMGADKFTLNELYSPQEQKELFADPDNDDLRAKRIQRISEKSEEFIKSIDPNITVKSGNKTREEYSKDFYLLVKS